MTEPAFFRRFGPPRRWILLGLIGLILLLMVAGWVLRKPIAVRSLNSWCGAREWTCQADLDRIDIDQLSVRNLKITTAEGEPVAADRIGLDVNWQWFRPGISAISAENPKISGALTDEGISLYGLEALFSNGGGGDQTQTPIPNLEIQNGDIALATTDGELTARVQVKGRPFLDGRVEITIPDQAFANTNRALDWSGGDLIIDFANGTTEGELVAQIGRVDVAGFAANASDLRVRLSDRDGNLAISGEAKLEGVAGPDIIIEDLQTSWDAEIGRLGELSLSSITSALRSLSVDLDASNLKGFGIAAETATSSIHMTEQGETGLSGPVSLRLVEVSGPVSATTIALSGDTQLVQKDWIGSSFDGTLTVESGQIERGLLRPLLDVLNLPTPFERHGESLKQSLSRAAENVSSTLNVRITQKDSGPKLALLDQVKVEATSGLSFTMTPPSRGTAITLAPDRIRAEGQLEISGGGAPDLKLSLEQAIYETGGLIALNLGPSELKPWMVDARSLSATIEEAEISSGVELEVMARGDLGLMGEFPGVVLQPSKISGGVQVNQSDGAWEVTTLGNGCLDVDLGSARAGAIIFDPFDLDLCPVNRRLISQGQSASTTRLPLGDVSLAFRSDETSGSLNLFDASARLSARSGLRFDFTGRQIEAPLQFGENTLTIRGQDPAVYFAANEGPLRFGAALAATRFDGSLIPFSVDAPTFTLNATAPNSGIAGTVDASDVRISDPALDPLFQPLVSNVSGTLDGLTLALGGMLRSEALLVPIADAQMSVNLATLTGTAGVTLRPLIFEPGTLNATDITERLRGVLTDAEGMLTGGANLRIDGGALSGTGHVDISDLAFKTFNFGTISGVNGRIDFSDVLGLKTPPGQQLRIAEMNIGLPLRDGVVSYQLRGPSEASLQGARWPLAGGVLAVLPTDWRLGARTHKVTVAAENVELEELIDVLSVPNLNATGTVSGNFPVDIEGANIFVRDARFVADAGGGTLSYTGEETDAVAAGNQYAEYAFDALKQLNYSVMELGANGNLIGDLVVTANIIGSNPEVLGGAEFKFGISIDSRLAELLTSLRGAPLETYAGEAYELIEENNSSREQ
ncbi:MAG: YdbH domain-containing protein [Pseudomonadota bacterium]